MDILAIGNSFSTDATRYLYGIARAAGDNLQVTNLYIGGCSLEHHYRNMLSNERAYALQSNGHNTGFSVSLSEALLNRKWDVISLQQVSHLAFDRESYLPYISALAEFARKCAPKAKLYLHQTWAYEEGSQRLLNIAKYDRADEMLRDVVKVNSEIAKIIKADAIIRSGELLGMLAKKGITGIHRDTFHASLGLGRYALGLVWYRALTKKQVSENMFRDFDEPISEEELRIIKESVDCLE